MAWMRMPEQTWFGAAASFLGMWIAMMVAMMLPCLVPMLWGYREAVGRTGETRLGRLTTLVGIGYFFVWTMLGVAIYPLGVALAAGEMQLAAMAHAVPMAVGVVILSAGAFQFTTWKAHHLAYCRQALACRGAALRDRGGAWRDGGGSLGADPGATAWRYGLHLGIQCCRCCANLMLIPLLIGVMDLRAMAIATLAISIERFMPGSQRIRQIIGAVIIAMGLVLITRAATT
jgi:predicted metal-binding membrane protein